MRDRFLILAGLAAATLVAGCAHNRTSGVTGHGGTPDEYAVGRAAPLVIPPDFALAPPTPGAPRPQEADSSTQALQALFGGEAPRSAAERSITTSAGGAAAPGIRSDVGAAAATTVDKGSTTRDILAAPAGNGRDATVSTPQ
jgi:hypothetical protein